MAATMQTAPLQPAVSAAPSPTDAWYFPAAGHEEALARLLYLIEYERPGGVMTGPSGVGKTTLLRMAAEEAAGQRRTVAILDLAGATASDVATRMLAACGLVPSSVETACDRETRLRNYLGGSILSGQPVVLIVDHVDRADADAAAGLDRLLAGLDETGGGLTLILSAGETLASEFAAVAGRWCELRVDVPAIPQVEIAGYLGSSVEAAGCDVQFDDGATQRLYAFAGGIPRLINRAVRLACLSAAADGQRDVSAPNIEAVLGELPAVPNAA